MNPVVQSIAYERSSSARAVIMPRSLVPLVEPKHKFPLNLRFINGGSLGLKVVGGSKPAREWECEWLRNNGFGAVVSLEEPLEPVKEFFAKNQISNLTVPIEHEEEPSATEYRLIENFVEMMLKDNRTVYIHCNAGIKRTGYVLSHLAWKYGGKVEDLKAVDSP